MTIWLDLIATPNNHLGELEIHGNEITPEIAKKAIKAISKKYDSRVRTLFFLRYFHSDLIGRDYHFDPPRHHISQQTLGSLSPGPQINQNDQNKSIHSLQRTLVHALQDRSSPCHRHNKESRILGSYRNHVFRTSSSCPFPSDWVDFHTSTQCSTVNELD